MSVLYLVRHGQAGTREDYDSLSHLGRTQARLLGEYFKAQEISFAAAYSGSLARQSSFGNLAARSRVIAPVKSPEAMGE